MPEGLARRFVLEERKALDGSSGCIQYQQWLYMAQCVDVVVTRASDIDDVLLPFSNSNSNV